MGDRRYDVPYETLAKSPDRSATLRDMSDDEVVHALAAASRRMDAYLANVLAVEVLRRQRRRSAALWGAVAGLASAVAARTVIFLLARPDPWVFFATTLAFLPAAAVGYSVYRMLLARSARGDVV